MSKVSIVIILLLVVCGLSAFLALRHFSDPDVTQPRFVRDLLNPLSPQPEPWAAFVNLPPKPAANLQAQATKTPEFLGADACPECHRSQYESFVKTPHYNSSSEPRSDTIRGSFAEGQNVLKSRIPELWFEMTAQNDGFFQTAHFSDQSWKFAFDLVVGSGKLAQTYLFWNGDELIQSHVSYFRESNGWVNSPGFADGTANYIRAIEPGCLNCHATYFQPLPESPNRYDKTNYVLGISCERCHGPGREHVDWHRTHKTDAEAKHIANPGQLSADRLNDVCGQCHWGNGDLERPAFSFRPGDVLAEFQKLKADDHGHVHLANQLGRMQQSQCFQKSDAMTCLTCHDPHQYERGQELFSQRCLSCHKSDHPQLSEPLGEKLNANCFECHMPKAPDLGAKMHSGDSFQAPLLRDHFIRIDAETTARVLKELN